MSGARRAAHTRKRAMGDSDADGDGESTPLLQRFKRKWPAARVWNAAAAAFHGLSFVLMFSLTIADAARGVSPAIPSSLRVLNGLPSANNYSSVTLAVPIYPRAMSILFTFLSMLFHFLISGFRGRVGSLPVGWLQYARNVRAGKNPIRWAEYGLSATVCLLQIQSLSGLTDFAQLTGAAGCNVGMIGCGHLAERLRVAEERDPDNDRKKLWQRGWFQAYVLGCVLGICPWISIFVYFYSALVIKSAPVPWFVYTIIWGMFFQFSGFAFVMLVQHFGVESYENFTKRFSCGIRRLRSKKVKIGEKSYLPALMVFLVKVGPTETDDDFEPMRACHRIVVRDFYELGEFLYVLLSFTSKTWLSWFSFFAPV